MGAYACTECDWQYDWHMGDRVEAVKRHQLAHLLEHYGWRNSLDELMSSLMTGEQANPDYRQPAARRV